MRKSILILLLLGIGSFTFHACFQNDRGNEDLLVTTADDLSASEDYSDQTDIDVDMAIEERGGSCPTVTFAQPEGTWPNTITIDFGASCTPGGQLTTTISLWMATSWREPASGPTTARTPTDCGRTPWRPPI